MDRWNLVLMIAGALVAVVTLVRMMRARRDLLVGQVRQQLEEHRRRDTAGKAVKEDTA